MKHLCYLLMFMCLLSFGACEKAMLASDEQEETPTTPSEEGGSTSGGESGGSEKEETPEASTNYYISGTQAYSVSDFLSKNFGKQIYVVAYIVGDCTQSISNANFTAPFSQYQAILLADDPTETDVNKVMSVQLSGKSRQEKYSLQSHPENKGTKLIAVYGYQRTYLGVPGMKSGKNAGIGSINWYDDVKGK